MGSIERCPTGIEGIDNLFGGGFPRGNIILLAGTPGAGKTTFAAKFLYEGARRYGEVGVYLSFIEFKYDFYKYMRALGMDFEELERKGLFSYIEGVQTQTAEGIEESLKEFLRTIIERDAKRAVIDSVTAIIQLVGFRGARELLKNAIIASLKPLDVTALLIAELAIGSTSVGFGVEEFLVDGVIILRSVIEEGVLVRRMEIRKMRGTEIPKAEIYFDIVPKDGIQVYVQERIEEIPAPSEEVLYEPPVEQFVNVFGSGLRRGTQVAIITQENIAGLMISLALIVPFIRRYGGKLLIRSYTKSPKMIESLLNAILAGYNMSSKDIRVTLESVHPAYRPIYILGHKARENDLRERPDFEIIDSLNQIPALYGWKDYIMIHSDNILTRRRLGITTFYIYYERAGNPLPIPLDLYDKIIKVQAESTGNCYLIRPYTTSVTPYLRPLRVCFSDEEIKWSVLTDE